MTFRTLDLNLLKVFEALMTEGSVTRAANALFMTQPAVSNALARLRESLGDPLFVRAGNGVMPTQRAAVLWNELAEALDRMRSALDPDAFDPARAKVEFSLSMSDYTAGIVMPPLCGLLARAAPQARVRTLPNNVVDIPDQLEDNRADCVLSAYINEAQYPGHIRSRSLWLVEYACFMRRDHPLASMKRLSTRAFLSARHVDVSLGGQTPPSYDVYLSARGLSRDVAALVNHYNVAYEMLRHTDMIAVLPRHLGALTPHAPYLHAMALPMLAPPRTITLFWHQRNDTVPAQRWLRQTLVDLYASGENTATPVP